MLKIYEVILDVLRKLGPVLLAIGRHDADLARQARRAAASVALNASEGMHAIGRNRTLRYATAMGSMRETRSALEVAHALGYLDALDSKLMDEIDHIVASLYKLSR